ncbi:MAG: YigZ family protein [Bacillota bacterium]|nr:YigZ family protein [Bacillota bacterium]
MSVLYKTIAKEAEASQIIEKSRFIAHAKSVSSKEEADCFVAEIRQKYKDATHNVPAYVIGDKMQIQWASDDGEPQGTSGAPIVQMIVGEGLTNICIVVTRYFGGIKLGTGGLVRAYTSSAKMAIEEAGIYEVRDFTTFDCEIAYNQLSRLQYAQKDLPFEIVSIIYEDILKITLKFEAENEQKIIDFLTELTSGNFQKK